MENHNANKLQSTDISQMASKYALRVALQTIKERCIAQDKRLNEVEEQNRKLKKCLAEQYMLNDDDDDGDTPQQSPTIATENVQLRLEITELRHQNEQLHNQMDMVSIENSKLWMRLSQMAKANTKTDDPDIHEDCTNIATCVMSNTPSTAHINQQNLIRSKTFTQHSPNPNLRRKLLMADSIASDDVLLADINSEETSAWTYEVDKTISPIANNYEIAANDFINSSIAPVMLNSDQATEDDFTMETKMCVDSLNEMHQQALQQQQNLNSLLNLMKKCLAVNLCLECSVKSVKPQMADKSLETDESLNELSKSDDNNRESTQQSAEISCPDTHEQHNNPAVQIKNVLEENHKICPMCGKIYNASISFREFCMHVENHFRDNSDDLNDESLEQSYDFATHTVGNF